MALRTATLGVLAGVLIAGVLLAGAGLADPPPTNSTYEQIVSQLKSGFTDVDYGKLRQAYAESDNYDPYIENAKQSVLAEAMKTRDCDRVISAANSLLAGDFTDIEAHIYAADCARQQHDQSTARFHLEVARGLLSSIAGSGDGKRPETAFVVVAVDEEYAWLFSQGFRIREQSLLKTGVHEFDAVDVFDQMGAERTIYFNIDRPAAWLAKKLPTEPRGVSSPLQHGSQ